MPGERRDAALVQPVRPLGPARLAHHDGARVRPRRLGAVLGDAVVADHRRGEADDLPAEARVGDDLLVAGHRGREDGLAEGVAGDRRSRRGRRLVLEHEEAVMPASRRVPRPVDESARLPP